MADYKEIFDKLAGKVREAADSSGVLDIYAQGTERAKALGQIAKLSIELKSEHDELAILVETAAGEKLGYVPRRHNPILARLMDAGKLLTAKVVHKELEDHWLNIRIAIDMKDL